MTMSTRELEERVEKGAAWLDRNVPDWVDRVEVQSLKMSDTCRCVLGQLFTVEVEQDPKFAYYSNHSNKTIPGYWRVVEDMWEYPKVDGVDRLTRQEAEELGFDITEGFSAPEDYTTLANVWSRLIGARRRAREEQTDD